MNVLSHLRKVLIQVGGDRLSVNKFGLGERGREGGWGGDQGVVGSRAETERRPMGGRERTALV